MIPMIQNRLILKGLNVCVTSCSNLFSPFMGLINSVGELDVNIIMSSSAIKAIFNLLFLFLV